MHFWEAEIARSTPHSSGLNSAPPSEATLDQGIEYEISDRAAHLLRQGECGARGACGVAEHRQLDFGAERRDPHRANAVDFELHAINVDCDRGEGEELAGANRGDREHGDRDWARSDIVELQTVHWRGKLSVGEPMATA